VAENGALLYRPATGERKGLGDPPPEDFIDRLKASGMPLSVGQRDRRHDPAPRGAGAARPSPTSASSTR
jgi:hypothetical protein